MRKAMLLSTLLALCEESLSQAVARGSTRVYGPGQWRIGVLSALAFA